jgi:hypothetical protein
MQHTCCVQHHEHALVVGVLYTNAKCNVSPPVARSICHLLSDQLDPACAGTQRNAQSAFVPGLLLQV